MTRTDRRQAREIAVRELHAEQAYLRTGTDCCCLEPGVTCASCLLGAHFECLDSSDRTSSELDDEDERD